MTAARRALVVVGKAPEPGRTKTRLSPPLSPQQAADLYRAFLHDTLAMAASLGWERVTLVYPPRRGARQELVPLVPRGVRVQPQPGTGLGAALAGTFRSHLEQRFERVVLIGSDNPTLPGRVVEDACRALDDHDLVVGPCPDGGYYLIGMKAPHLGVFEQIAWSTDVVYRQTLDRARQLGLRVRAVAEWYDVDTAADLRRLRADLAGASPTVAAASRRLLAEMADVAFVERSSVAPPAAAER